MNKLTPLFLFLLACDVAPPDIASARAALVGDACGDCSSGVFDGTDCVYPSAGLADVLANGLAPVDTGTRQVFHTSSWGGTDNNKLKQAGLAATAVNGAVVIDSILSLTATGLVYDNVLYTGGGVRRACGPHAVTTAAVPSGTACMPVDTTTGFTGGTHLATTDGSMNGSLGTFGITVGPGLQICRTGAGSTFAVPAGTHVVKVYPLLTSPTVATGGTIFDSVLIDGGGACNSWTHDWRYNTLWSLRGGSDAVRHSWVYDTPSEAFYVCADSVTDNIAVDLGGSLVHKTCSTAPTDERAVDFVARNYVENANRFTDAVMGHSEGVVVFSANATLYQLHDNVFRIGGEGALGRADATDEDMGSQSDCFAHFSSLLTVGAGADPASFRFDELVVEDCPGAPDLE